MQNMLRKGAKFCYERGYFTYEQMHNYFMSGKNSVFTFVFRTE